MIEERKDGWEMKKEFIGEGSGNGQRYRKYCEHECGVEKRKS